MATSKEHRSSSRSDKRKEKIESGADTFGKKGPQFLTMTRADYNAYEYLCRQAEAKEWIEAVLGEKLPDADLYKSLADGIALGKLINLMYPGSIKTIAGPSSYAWKLRENIQKFLNVCQNRAKLEPFELFQVGDLFDKKNMPKVMATLQTLAEKAAKEGFQIKWHVKQHQQFSNSEIQEAKKLEGVNLWATPSKIDEEEKRKREQAEKEKAEAELKAQQELERRRKQEEEERALQLEKERARLEELEREERRRRKEEEEKKKREEELEVAKRKQEREREAELLKKQKEQEELERRKKAKEEEEALKLAKKYGNKSNLDVIKKIVADLKQSKLSNGDTPLHEAVNRQLDDVVRYLLEEEKADPSARNDNANTPLHLAAAKDSGKITEMLTEKGAKVSPMNKDGDTPLHVAARVGKLNQVISLLKSGHEVDPRNDKLETPLLVAMKSGHTPVVQELVKHGADVNTFDKFGDYPLHIAAENGSVPQVNELWNNGLSKLNLNPRNKDNATPLQVAAEKQYLPVVKRLIELGADINTKQNDGWSPLYTTAYNGDYQTVVLLCSKGADVNSTNEEGWTPLHAACSQGHFKVVQTMIEDFHAQINILNDQGTSPLFHAAATGRRKIVDFLLEKKADVNLSLKDGWKPIHAACYNEYTKIVQVLTKSGASLSHTCKDIRGYSPLHILIATEKPPIDLIKLVVENDPSAINIASENGGTPLHLAAFWGHLEVTKILLDAGAGTETKNEKRRTALDIAARYSHKAVAELLADYMGVDIPEMKANSKKLRQMDFVNEPPKPENYVEKKRNSSQSKK